MDDVLEKPQATATNAAPYDDEADQSSEDEDGGLDWTKLLPASTSARPVIPKRGEKDFEPAAGGESGWQRYNLDRARTAMFDALRATRAISSKSVSYGVWYPSIGRTHISVARGGHFSSMGHSVVRPSSHASDDRAPKRLELLPEETLFLVEKGSLFCWKVVAEFPIEEPHATDEALKGAPMSVQQAFAEIIGKEGLTLERYQVFSYLKRLGYVVRRAKPPSLSYPKPASHLLLPSRQISLSCRLYSRLLEPVVIPLLRFLFQPAFNWWRPIVHSRWLHHNMSYLSILESLRFISSGHSVPLHPAPPSAPQSPYEVFYHLYKPSTTLKKTSPPPPDFSIVVVNARTTPIPTLIELTSLYHTLPTIPPPLPRQRHLPPPSPTAKAIGIERSAPADPLTAIPTKAATPYVGSPDSQKVLREEDRSSSPLFLQRLFSLLPFVSVATTNASPKSVVPPPRRVNPFMALRQGDKTVVIAAVDAGVISFFRFGEGNFDEWPMV